MMFLVTSFLKHFTYVALVLVLLAAGMGVPVPEDIPLITSGWLCNPQYSPILEIVVKQPETLDPDAPVPPKERPHHVPHLPIMIFCGLFGVLAGDSILWYIGHKGLNGDNFVARHIRKVMHSHRREWVERHFARHGNLTVFAGRFMPGARSIVFAMAGMSGMSYFRFIAINGIASAISVPTFICVGFYFARDIKKIEKFITQTKEIILPIVLVAAVVALIIYLLRRQRTKQISLQVKQ